MSVPSSIEELKEQLLAYNVSKDDIDKFEAEIEDADHDIDSIKEDIKDKEQSMLFDFFRDELDGKEAIYDIVKAIMDGKAYIGNNVPPPHKEPPLPKDTPTQPTPIAPQHPPQETKTIDDDQTQASDKAREKWDFNKKEEKGGDGTVILNAGLIIIPDKVICDQSFLENIRGITHVLYWNNARINPPRLPYSYIDFWKVYLEEENPTYAAIASDILHNQGPTYDYLTENPPNDRILPVLEKVVDQLKHPMLDSAKDKRSTTTYKNDIQRFFDTQTPDYFRALDGKIKDRLIRACVLFKKNTNDTNFNIFELFINMIDVYDRILYDKIQWGLKKPLDITKERNNWGKEQQILEQQHHFAARLRMDDYYALNETLHSIKDSGNHSFFPRLSSQIETNKLINDDVGHYQCISLSFLLFVKSFICDTGNCLDRGYHIYKAPKKRDKKKRNRGFELNIMSLKEIKCERKNDTNATVDDGDILFHNDNMPLQFDLCILPIDIDINNTDFGLKEENKEENKEDSKENNHREYAMESETFVIPSDKDSIYKLYGQLVTVFRRVLIHKKNKKKDKDEDNSNEKPQQKQGNRGIKIVSRRDDRYCIVFDRNHNKFYMYPPHIKHGVSDQYPKIVHKKDINPKSQQNTDKDKEKEKEKDNVDKEEEDNREDNKFSFISHEYNDLTNFYLTSKCMIPSRENKDKVYGIDDDRVQFVLSAHFHKQRQWHRHPKLRIYQYFNGGALRFFYSPKEDQYGYKWAKDIVRIWPKYFKFNEKEVDEEFIKRCLIFDEVLDLYKCDAQYFQWDNAVKRQLK